MNLKFNVILEWGEVVEEFELVFEVIPQKITTISDYYEYFDPNKTYYLRGIFFRSTPYILST